jgi:hypothetical protein
MSYQPNVWTYEKHLWIGWLQWRSLYCIQNTKRVNLRDWCLIFYVCRTNYYPFNARSRTRPYVGHFINFKSHDLSLVDTFWMGVRERVCDCVHIYVVACVPEWHDCHVEWERIRHRDIRIYGSGHLELGLWRPNFVNNTNPIIIVFIGQFVIFL